MTGSGTHSGDVVSGNEDVSTVDSGSELYQEMQFTVRANLILLSLRSFVS